MPNSRVWVIIGAADGLGPGAIKYLILKKQIVIALVINPDPMRRLFEDTPKNLHIINIDSSNRSSVSPFLKRIAADYGPIDFIINNSNYHWFKEWECNTHPQIQRTIDKSVFQTIELIKELLPYLSKEPKGSIINIPPQLCLETLKDKSQAGLLCQSMDMFLKALFKELQNVDCRLSFLEPGERLSSFTD